MNLVGVFALFSFVSWFAHAASKDPTLLYPSQLRVLGGKVQSRFVGPVDLRVWKHEQPSWNIEDKTSAFDFELIRGFDSKKKPFVKLRFHNTQDNLEAEIWGVTAERISENDLAMTHVSQPRMGGVVRGEWTEFHFADATDFLDAGETRVVTFIGFRILGKSGPIYEYKLYPMYVRGEENRFWKSIMDSLPRTGNSVDENSVLYIPEGFGKWNSVPVDVRSAHIESTELSQGSSIKPHRHEKNQELWWIRSGQFLVMQFVSHRHTPNYQTFRVWDSQGSQRQTDEFVARGGWLETRVLSAGDMMTLAPNPSHTDSVYGHGLKALCHGVFQSRGDRN